MTLRFSRTALIVATGLVALAASDEARAVSRCDPGKLNQSGLCECPPSHAVDGPPGSQTCKAKGAPAPFVGPKPGPGTLPPDAGASITIKGGQFNMGDSLSPGAGPIRPVTMSDFAIDKYEVSAGEFKKCVDAGVCSAPPAGAGGTASARCNYNARGAHPMNCVSYGEASTYCQWKNKRLPTEAEWEFAARGTAGRTYAWGLEAPTCKLANFSQTASSLTPGCGEGTAAIGSKPAGKTPLNVNDLTGNVEEWTWDWYGVFTGKATSNPGGPLTGVNRVAKGSAYDQSAISDQASARREGVPPGSREAWLGFRCATGNSPNATPSDYVPPVSPNAGPSDLGAMMKIPGGTFKMGSPLQADAQPERLVTLSPYLMDKYEVTVGEYKKCVASGNCLTPLNSISPNCNYDKPGKDAHPVNCVEWADSKKFCGYVGKRLPTEAEWEFAARGTDGRIYPWGSSYPTCSNAAFKQDNGAFCTGSGTNIVGKYPAGTSYWGVHDMGGNIEEWTFDFWGKYPATPSVNPSGPLSGTGHAVRGGNWEIGQAQLRTFDRFHFDTAKYWIGFRCAKTGS